MSTESGGKQRQMGLALAALGVVYGDIGTSPLYALKECFLGPHGVKVSPEGVLGILSLIFWTLTGLVSIKYLLVVMRANNRGEGGILALHALLHTQGGTKGRVAVVLGLMAMAGAGLLYGDGILTPSLTVLSAVEGLAVAVPALDRLVVPLTVIVLILLFSVQRHGSGKVGMAFGPVMMVWFFTIAVLGVKGILLEPSVLYALNPLHAIRFLVSGGLTGLAVLGSVFLVVTGAEALYADMGHFGPRPIRFAWFRLVFPALFLNYLGQGALVLRNPEAIANPFYALAPTWGQLPLVVLATAAAVIASQALISGVFSLTMQAVQLGFLPRETVMQTSSHQRGQVFLPRPNAMLLVSCLALVLLFQSSSRLAAAYGIAVSLTMLITTILATLVARRLWRWPLVVAVLFGGFFLAVEALFFGANLVKFLDGGWIPLAVAAGSVVVMTTWQRGRFLLRDRMAANGLPLAQFLGDVGTSTAARVPGTAVFMVGNPELTPLALLHNLKHNRVLHVSNIFLTVSTQDAAHVPPAERITVEALAPGFHRVVCRVGFMDAPDVPELLRACEEKGLTCNPNNASYFLSRETILVGAKPGMRQWRKALFSWLSRNAQRATAFFNLPANRVVELGMLIEL